MPDWLWLATGIVCSEEDPEEGNRPALPSAGYPREELHDTYAGPDDGWWHCGAK